MLWFMVLGILCIILYYKTIKPLSYWKNNGVVYKQSYPIVGSFGAVVFQRQPLFYYIKETYQQFSKERYYGIYQFNKAGLFIRDLELIKRIAIKDFDHFTDHMGFAPSEFDMMFRKNLFNLQGQGWRGMRATLSPSFTSNFTNYFKRQTGDTLELEMKDVFTRFTNDAIATTAFGIKCNSLQNRNDEFYLMAKDATNITGLKFFKFLLYNLFPGVSRFLKLRVTPVSVNNFFQQIIKDTIWQREKEGLFRPDMIHLLMEARKEVDSTEETHLPETSFAAVQESRMIQSHKRHNLDLSEEDIASQALLFIFGGFETSSSLLTFTAYELAVNPKIQERLQKEIDDTLNYCNGKLTYEVLHKMKYMDMLISETLRKWPPCFQNDRVCVKDYLVEPVNPWENKLLIKKGMIVLFPVVGIHHDPQYFPNPEEFNPDRFSDENKHNIKPISYFPFGVGPRNCIASRFALMEVKVLIFYLLSKFDIVKTKKTPIPIIIAKGTINFVAEGGFWLGLKQRLATSNY
ncbi:hypothetical protein RN001_013364 [Aquatica leii]|uniref:Cytochrome P450 n=1 Tax=Aquatica leii TaxID=1421715 RepID=A0AAN7SDU8_9COLE|nr:hypothetical protein RN001_013364 [Aquatica leii]